VRILRDLAASDERRAARIEKKREEILAWGVPPPAFCQRVRKLLIGRVVEILFIEEWGRT
jgi:hypothetical protein